MALCKFSKMVLAGALAVGTLALAPLDADAQSQRVSVRGALGLMQTFGGDDFAKLDPGTVWELEGRLRPIPRISIGGGMRGISRRVAETDFKISGWFVEPRLHGGPMGGGLFSVYLAARGTFGEQRFNPAGIEYTESTTQIEIGPGVNVGMSSRFAVDVAIFYGREELGDLNFATPVELDTRHGLVIRAGVEVGIY